MFFEPIYILQALNRGTCLRQGDLFYSAGLHMNLVLATANTGEIRRGFGKNAGEWTGRVEYARQKSLAVSVACMAIHWPTPGFKGRTFKVCVLTEWDFNFCVRSSPLRGTVRGPETIYIYICSMGKGNKAVFTAFCPISLQVSNILSLVAICGTAQM